jgi:hypothetical protein
VRVRARREPHDDVIVRLVGQEQRHRIARHDLANQHPDERAHVRELRVAPKGPRQTADRQHPIIQTNVFSFHDHDLGEERNRGQSRASGEGIPTGDRALVRSARERPRKIVLF